MVFDRFQGLITETVEGAYAPFLLCAEHVRQLGSVSLLSSLMAAKG
jgi:hypothetical protein